MGDLLADLAELIGPHRVDAHPSDLARHSADRSPRALADRRAGRAAGAPLAVVRPHSVAQVADLLRWADTTRTPVVPYGGGSGVVEGIVPAGCVVVEMRAMNEVLDLDERSRLVRVQAGMEGPDLTKALASWGFTLGHEPQSLALSTVGGWVATRATGQLSGRYGGIEAMVAGLEAVLPGGHIARSKPVPRRSAGPDVAALMIGSEGALGIVTEVTLRLHPLVEERVDLCLRFEHMRDGIAACRALAQSELAPAVVRLYDREDTALLLRSFPDETGDLVLLLSFEGHEADRRAAQAAELAGGEPGDEALASHWWAHRNDAAAEYARQMRGEGELGAHALVDTVEVAGTWSVLRDLYHSMKEALTPLTLLTACHVSHVYPDGACLYFTLAASCSSEDEVTGLLDRWWETAMERCLAAGGSISHHHGIGRRKARWLPEEIGGWFEVLRAVKSAVDPNGIMNPGVLGL